MGLAEQINSLQDYFESFDPVKIYWTIIICIWVEYAFELYLCLRQVSSVKTIIIIKLLLF